jgi:opacity protein-like surface antigen
MFSRNWLAGIEADASSADLEAHGLTTTPLVTIQGMNKVDLFGTVRGRLGYAWNNWLVYGTGGFAWADERESRSQIAGVIGGATPGTVESASSTVTGWTAGGGVEWGFASSWTAKVEYLHLDFGMNTFVFPIAHRQTDAALTADVVRAGVNYRF